MSHTDHARPQKTRGHVTTVRHVRHYNGAPYFQSVCSCGQVGSLATFWHVANNDSRDHQRKVHEQRKAEM